jgi:hypothetical protein
MASFVCEIEFMKSFALLLLVVFSASQHVSAAVRPNIVFIFADDWGWVTSVATGILM